MAEEKKAAKKAKPDRGPTFIVTNVVRRVQTRLRRSASPGRGRFKQIVCGRRLLRNQKMPISAALLEEYKHLLYPQVKNGYITITGPDGTVLQADHLGNLIARKGQDIVLVDGPDKGKKLSEAPPPPEPKDEPEEVEEVEEPEDELEEPESEVTEVAEPKSDDLTALDGIGPGRARKLEESGLTTLLQVAEAAPSELAKLLNMTEDAAAEICNAASEKEEV
jgi:predicted flap endonuclease-1-like 5' DNA nuclease